MFEVDNFFENIELSMIEGLMEKSNLKKIGDIELTPKLVLGIMKTHLNWASFVGKMFDEYDDGTPRLLAIPAHRKGYRGADLLMQVTLPPSANMVDGKSSLLGANLEELTDHNLPLAWSVPTSSHAKGEWFSPSAGPPRRLHVQHRGKNSSLLLTDEPSVKLITAASSAFARPMAAALTGFSQAETMMKDMHLGSPSDMEVCTAEGKGDCDGRKNPGLYRFWDGAASGDNTGVPLLLAKLQQEHGLARRLRLLVLDNSVYWDNPAWLKRMPRRAQHALEDSVRLLFGLVFEVEAPKAAEFTKVGGISYLQLSTTTKQNHKFGVQGGSKVDLLVVCPSEGTTKELQDAQKRIWVLNQAQAEGSAILAQSVFEGTSSLPFSQVLQSFVSA